MGVLQALLEDMKCFLDTIDVFLKFGDPNLLILITHGGAATAVLDFGVRFDSRRV